MMSTDEDVTTIAGALTEPGRIKHSELLTEHMMRPYNELPALPPSTQLETIRTLKKAISANMALAELRVAGDLIPNQSILLRSILLQEAKMSSEIENIVTTNDELYRAFSEDADRADPSTKEVLRYERALWTGWNELRKGRKFSVELFIEIARIIKQEAIGIRSGAGTQIVNRHTGEAIYVPPVGEAIIREKLENLVSYFYANDGIDPLIKMAAAHYQFEAIHPFPDGNGRTGRVLNILYLVSQNLLSIPVLYLSCYIIGNKRPYYQGLRRVTEEGAWEEWILYMLDGMEQTAIATKDKILSIREAIGEATAKARTEMNRGYSKELIELVFEQPYTRISFLEQQGIAKRDTASAYLKDLVRLGILRGVKHGRERLYINLKLLRLLAS